MIAFRTDKITKPEKLLKLKKESDKIGNKYKDLICEEINAYAKKIGIPMRFSVIIDLKLYGKRR